MLFRICLILSHILPTVYRIILKSLFLSCFLLRNRFFHRWLRIGSGRHSFLWYFRCGRNHCFFEDFPVETCFFSFLSSEESYTVKKGSLPEAFPAADNCKRFAPDRITIGLLRKTHFIGTLLSGCLITKREKQYQKYYRKCNPQKYQQQNS